MRFTNFTTQLTYFKTFINFVPEALVWGYFSILIYRETISLALVFTEKLVFLLALFIGFVITSFFLDKVGHLTAYRTSLGMNALALLLLLILKDNLEYTFVLIALFFGISRGIYWTIEHSILTRNLAGHKRSSFINKIISLQLIITTTLPLFAGTLITLLGNYDLLILIALIISIISLSAPFKYNFKETTNLKSSELKIILKKRGFKYFAFTNTLIATFQSLYASLFLIVPFLFLKDELNVGILASVLGLIAALLSFLERNIKEKLKIRFGYIIHIVWIFATILFAIFWTPTLLLVQSVVTTFVLALGFSVRSNEEYQIRKKILGKDLVESTSEMNLLLETFYISGRIFIFGGIIVLLSFWPQLSDTPLRIIVPSIPIVLLYGYHRIIKQSQKR